MQPLRKRRRRTLASADEEQEARLLGAPAPFDGSSSEDEGPVYLGAALASVDAAEHDEALLHVEPEGDGALAPAQWTGSVQFKLAAVPAMARTFVSRAVVNLRRLSREVLHAILAGIEQKQKHVSPSLSVACYLFDLAPTNIHRLVSTPAVEEEVPAAVDPPQSKKSSEAILATLVRTSLMCAIENASRRQFRSRLRSLAFEGVDVGDKYHSGTFYQHATFLAARYIDLISAHRARMPLAGLGVPSSFHLVFDSVPLGGVQCVRPQRKP